MNKKIILDLCGGTGSWSLPYKEAGYDVKVITQPEHDVFEYQKYREFIYDIHGILAAPTCTMFSLARTTAKTPRDLEGGFKLVHRCMEIIWDCRFNGNLKFWALENPMGYLRQLLGKPHLTFNPCDFAGWADCPKKEGYTKKTDLWDYYNTPKKNPIELTDQQMRDCSINNRTLPEVPEDYISPEGFRSQTIRRSMTSSGFARAFFKANK